jgi:hypothetical protein
MNSLSQDSRSRDRDLNSEPPDYESYVPQFNQNIQIAYECY